MDIEEKEGVSQPALMTRKQVAAYLGVSIPTVGKWMKQGLPFLLVQRGRVNSDYRFPKKQVDEWIAAKTQSETTES